MYKIKYQMEVIESTAFSSWAHVSREPGSPRDEGAWRPEARQGESQAADRAGPVPVVARGGGGWAEQGLGLEGMAKA